MTRLVLFTGKGGVGKTTTAAASAMRCAQLKHRTLVLSTDPAHSLADALGRPLGDRPVAVAKNLDAQQLDARVRLVEQWGELRSYLAKLGTWSGLDAIAAEELTVLPGLEEILALTDVSAHASSGLYDVVVIDCAPTAETLRLLSLPDVMSWWMDRLFPLGRQVSRVVAPVVRQLAGGLPLPDAGAFDAVERLYTTMRSIRDLLTDAETTSIRLVVNPERVVLAEARRTATYLALFGFPIDGVIVNRLLPDAVIDPWFDKWRISQRQQLEEIERDFAPVPVLRCSLAGEEPIGPKALRSLARELYGSIDPSARLHDGEILRIERRPPPEMGWLLTLPLPFSDKGDVSLVRRSDELFVSVGSYRRALVLPSALHGSNIETATVADGRLAIRFGDRGVGHHSRRG